jgi:mannan endo-1,6-alpha-mannosidase
MRRGRVLAYGAAICASWGGMVDAIDLDLTSTGK